jgi:hypothetical protein
MQDSIKKPIYIIWIKFNKILRIKNKNRGEWDNKMQGSGMRKN